MTVWRIVGLLVVVWSLLGAPTPVGAVGNCGVFYSYRVPIDTVTSANLNSNFTQAATTNSTPQCVDDYSADLTQMRATVDPFPSAAASLATTLDGELRRLRFILVTAFGWSQWYQHTDAMILGPTAAAGTNTAGNATTLRGGQGTGTGVGGDLLFRVAYPGSSGSTANSLTTVGTVTGTNNASSGTNVLWSLAGTVNQSSTAGYTLLRANVTETATGSGTNNLLELQRGGTNQFSVNRVGAMFINDTANANVTIGVTVNQGTNDDGIVALKSSDVAHGWTGRAETDTYAIFFKAGSTSGGLQLETLMASAGSAPNFSVLATGGTEETTASTTANAFVQFRAQPGSGTSFGNAAANSLIFGVQTTLAGSSRSIFFIDAEGDLFVDGSTTLSAFDHERDVLLARALDLEFSAGVIRTPADARNPYTRADLERAGILSAPTDGGGPMLNLNRSLDLLRGAAWQTSLRIDDLETRLWARLLEQERELAQLRAELETVTRGRAGRSGAAAMETR